MLVLASSARLIMTGNPVAAGFVFAFCAIKFHLFLLAPVLVVARKLWPFGGGLLMGIVLLAALSFTVAGCNWPLQYKEMLEVNELAQDSYAYMPNLNGLFKGHKVPYGTLWLLVATIATILVAWRAFARASILFAFALVPAGGVLIGLHSYLYDCMFLLPALLHRMETDDKPELYMWGAAMLGLATLLLTVPSASYIAQFLIVGTVVAAMLHSARGDFDTG
jgi:hypothetical protein